MSKTFDFYAEVTISADVVLPNDDFVEYAIAFVPEALPVKWTELNAKAAEFLPDHTNVVSNPHVTAYHGAYKQEDLPVIVNGLKALDIKPFNVTFVDRIVNTGNRWLDWNIEKFTAAGEETDVVKVHKKIVDFAVPFHQRPLARSIVAYPGASEVAKAQIGEYGVGGIKEFYNPHATFWYEFPPHEDLTTAHAAMDGIITETVTTPVNKIICGRLGFNGNIVEIYETIDLLGSSDVAILGGDFDGVE